MSDSIHITCPPTTPFNSLDPIPRDLRNDYFFSRDRSVNYCSCGMCIVYLTIFKFLHCLFVNLLSLMLQYSKGILHLNKYVTFVPNQIMHEGFVCKRMLWKEEINTFFQKFEVCYFQPESPSIPVNLQLSSLIVRFNVIGLYSNILRTFF